MSMDDYTPCRMSECFLDENGEIEAISNTGTLRLKGIGRSVWHMLDGKHTIHSIVDKICLELGVNERELIQKELITLLNTFKDKGVIVINWDPIYKLTLSQEIL